jgi:CRISPR/Cas system CSM-associated protein Csm5 (group 7 of RAMP superfamily)
MMENDTAKLYIHVLSPVHVGGGQEKYWVNGVHYLYESNNKTVMVFDLEKLGSFLSEDEINQYTNALESGKAKEFFDYLANTRHIPFSKFSKAYYMPYQPEGEIKTMIRTGLGEPYIPGSSIKGAIRSAIFSWAYHNDPRIKREIDRLNQSADTRGLGNKMDESLFGKIENNLMRFIQVTDAMFKDTVLFNTKVFNLFEDRREREWYGGWKHAQKGPTNEDFKPRGFSSTFETLEINDWATFRVKTNKTIWDLMGKYPETPRPSNGSMIMAGNPLEKLFGMINFATRKYIQSEIEFFETFPAEKSDSIVDELNEILATIPDDNKACGLKMGAGNGFHAITGNWQFEDFTDTGFHEGGRFAGKKKYKSRKISFSRFETDEGTENLFFPMGFVKIYSEEAWQEMLKEE